MPLEAVMVCMDNSDYMRNCDYAPTRMESQSDAVHLLCGAKAQQNPESAVGILCTAGGRVEVLVTPTSDLGQMLAELPRVEIGGEADLVRGLQVAQLALKHRHNKNQKQRIVAFVGSPIDASDKELEVLGKNLKKNNVALDLVSFGEIEDNTAKLQVLLNAVNSNNMSHILEVPVGPKLISDALLSSAIIYPDGDAPMMGGDFMSGDGFDMGDDPELALALRISMEEEKARQERLKKEEQPNGEEDEELAAAIAASAAEGGAGQPASRGGDAAAASSALPVAGGAAAIQEALNMEDMDEELRLALLASLQDEQAAQEQPPAEAAAPGASEAAAAPAAAAAEAPKEPEKAGGGQDAAPEAPPAPPAAAKPTGGGAEEVAAKAAPAPAEAAAASASAPAAATEEPIAIDTKWFQDTSFMQELLGSLPGVDIGDAAVQRAIKEAQERATQRDQQGGRGGAGGGQGSSA